MPIEIDSKIVNKTSRCDKAFQCLENNKPYCEVEDFMLNNFAVVKCNAECSCRYKINHKSADICYCPVRKEIYRNYMF